MDTAGVNLLETLAAELERPRDLTSQVVNHLLETYGITREQVGDFLEHQLGALEDYEIDLIFSPLFTPTLCDQSICAGMLGEKSISPAEQQDLIQRLVQRPTTARLRTEDGVEHGVPLREVTVERYVSRLRLEGAVQAGIDSWLNRITLAAEQSLWQAVARRAIWESPGRLEILDRYLESRGNVAAPDELAKFTRLIETYQPANPEELLGQIPHWQQVLRQEINDSGSRPFFNERVEELHGGGRDQRRGSVSRQQEKEAELEFLGALASALVELR